MGNTQNDDTPFYSDTELRYGIEKIRAKIKNKSNIYAIYEVGFWHYIWPYLDKELLTYGQKKVVAREVFPLIEKIRSLE